MKILTDQAINHKDEDSLYRVGFAEHIADGILKLDSKENFCLALHGSWGSGKTSIINLCLEAIKEKTKELSQENKPIIIRFQPWLISGQEQLIKAFLNQFRKALGRPELSKFANEASKKLETFENLLGYASWIPTAGEILGEIKKIVSNARETTQAISKQLEEDLESNKKSICNALLKLRSPVIVIIDDVDRLTSEEIRQLFQLMKAVADFPKTIYFLAFDHKLVEKALESFQSGSETRYLEKIIQLDFEVPTPSRSQIATVLWNGIDDIIEAIPSEENELARWNEMKFGPLPAICRNIRDVKRFLNAVNFKYSIVKGEIATVDILIVEAIRIFSPLLYKAIRDNKENLVSNSALAMSNYRDNKEKNGFINSLPELAPEYCKEEMKEMLSHLFPEVESIFKQYEWDTDSLRIWDNNQRICISSYFDYYFQSTLPAGAVSTKEISRVIELLNNQDSLTLLLRNYMSDGRATKLLSKVEHYIKGNIDRDAIQNLITAVFKSVEMLPFKHDDMSEISSDWAIQATVYRLLKNLDKNVRKDILLNAMLSKDTIVFPIMVASYIWKEWNSVNGKESTKSNENKLLSKEEADELKDYALTLIKNNKNTDLLYKSRHLISTLYYWEIWSNNEEVRKWVETIISDEKKIPEFLGGCGGFIGTAGMSSHYATYKFKVNNESLEKFCDIQLLKEKCEGLLKIDPEWLTHDYREIIKVFLEDFEGSSLQR